MSQTPSSTPRPILTNKTNVESSQSSQRDTPQTLALLSPPADSKRPANRNWVLGARKRVRIDQEHRDDDDSSDESESEHDAPIQSARRHNVFGIRDAFMTAGPSSWGRLAMRECLIHCFVRLLDQSLLQCPHVLSCKPLSRRTGLMCTNANRCCLGGTRAPLMPVHTPTAQSVAKTPSWRSQQKKALYMCCAQRNAMSGILVRLHPTLR